jgi:hypothetical protein
MDSSSLPPGILTSTNNPAMTKNQPPQELVELFQPTTYASEQEKIRANLERLRRERLEREASQSKPN